MIGTLVTSFQAYQKANEGATVAQWLMNAAMNANPIVLVVTLIAGLVTALITLWHTNEDFRNALISAWETIKSAATEIFSSVANFFTETIPNAFNNVLDWFKNIGERFEEIGKNIIDGIRNGISNSWENLKKWFTGLFDGLVGGVKDTLGIHSPSKVFANIGGFMAEGLAEGWDKEYNGIKRSIENGLNFGSATVDFSSSGLGVSSAGIINGVANSGSESGGAITVNLMLPDGTAFARYFLPSFIDVARSDGTPILNPL